MLSDKALIGVLKVIVDINRDVQLLTFTMTKGSAFLLRMGFGLHAGWAIEGAVGSLQQVDATYEYLSPHVNMAARMEAATRQFGVSILMTRNFFKVRILWKPDCNDFFFKHSSHISFSVNVRDCSK